MASQSPLDSKAIGAMCVNIVEESFRQMGNLSFSQDPVSVKRDIIEYSSRMRVFGMEMFNGPCYISVVNYYFSQSHVQRHDACGAFVLYVEEGSSEKLFKALGYRDFHDEDEATMLETCGKLCNVLGGNFKNELAKQGFGDLVMSAPQNYHNSVPEGVEFHYDEYSKSETSFYLWKEKIVAADITLSLAR